MADKKISALTAATTPLAGTEVLPIVQSGSTVKVSIADVTAGRSVSASGIVNSLGAVGTPSYTFTGDLNTGMWSPAADTIAMSTAGAERMRLTAAGNLGIGTTAPLVKLHVSDGNIRLVATSDGNNGIFQVYDTSTATLFSIYNDSAKANLTVLQAKPMVFYTTNTERMRISATGDVGIGTSTPASNVDVRAAAPSFRLQETSSGGDKRLEFSISNTAIGRISAPQSASQLAFETTGSERMRIDASGNLGIGTSSPSAKLDVVGGDFRIQRAFSGANTPLTVLNTAVATKRQAFDIAILQSDDAPSLRITEVDSSTSAVIGEVSLSAGDGNVQVLGSTGPMVFATGRSASIAGYLTTGEKMRLDASGNLGLGVTPGAWGNGQSLQGSAWAISTGTGFDNTIISTNARQTAYGSAQQNWVYRGTAAASSYAQSAGSHYWLNAPSGTAGAAITFAQAMTLDGSGNLSLSLTPSAWGTNYKAVQAVRANLYGAATYGWYGVLFNAYSDNTNFIYQSTNRAGEYRFDVSTGAHAWFNAPSGTAGNNVTFTQAMTLDASGNLGVGISTPAQGIHISRSTAVKSAIRFDNSVVSGNMVGTDTDGSLYAYQGGAYPFIVYTSATERMRITATGNVGIGTSSPSSALEIARGSATTAAISLRSNAVSTAGELFIGQDGGNAAYFYNRSNSFVALGTNNTERMRITDAGNLQLGTASLATNATNGFPYIPTCAGTPTGTPTAITGYAPMVVDSTNNKLYVYVGGAWQAMN